MMKLISAHPLPCSVCPSPPVPCSFGDIKSADPSIFLGVYQLYFFFPLLVIARLYADRPFARSLPGWLSTALWVYGSATFAVFFSYVAKWLALHMAHELPAAIVAALEATKSLP